MEWNIPFYLGGMLVCIWMHISCVCSRIRDFHWLFSALLWSHFELGRSMLCSQVCELCFIFQLRLWCYLLLCVVTKSVSLSEDRRQLWWPHDGFLLLEERKEGSDPFWQPWRTETEPCELWPVPSFLCFLFSYVLLDGHPDLPGWGLKVNSKHNLFALWLLETLILLSAKAQLISWIFKNVLSVFPQITFEF